MDGEGDLVLDRDPAAGNRRVPVEAELRAVHDGLELEAELRVAERILDRADDGALRGDALGVARDLWFDRVSLGEGEPPALDDFAETVTPTDSSSTSTTVDPSRTGGISRNALAPSSKPSPRPTTSP